MTDADRFLSRFSFKPERAGWLGFEREYFLLGQDGVPVPESPRFLAALDGGVRKEWTYELSACQVEHHPGPFTTVEALEAAFRAGEETGVQVAASLGLTLGIREVGPAYMPTEVYPDDPRYATIAKAIPHTVLLAACRVTATQIHYGAGSVEHGIRVLNALVNHLDELIEMGDSSGGERIRFYRMMAPYWRPRHLTSVGHFVETVLEDIRASGSSDLLNPRNCWHLVRISRHGSVEVRAFGSTEDHDRIMSWVRRVKAIGDAA